MTRHESLTQAADLIASYAATLDQSSHTCACCQRVSYNSFPERQMAVELTAIVNKLRRFAQQPERNAAPKERL